MDNTETARVVYEAAVRAAGDQAAVLDGLRVRAGTVLAAAALVSSFLGGQALRSADHLRVLSFVGLAVGSFVLSALLALAILWPFDFRFSLSARAMLEALGEHDGAPSTTEFFRALALQLEWRYVQNRRKIRRLLWAFELGILCLVLEVAAWLVVLWRQ
jgi:hypothetical protein